MGESANLCENRLLSYRGADNAAFTTRLRFLRGFTPRSRKTEAKNPVMPLPYVKTRKPFPFEQTDAETFARCRKHLRGSSDAKYTYFMRDGVSGLIKIGMSADPNERRMALAASGARSMEILLVLRDGNLEGCYHQHFADLRVEGEWFLPHPDIFAEIDRCSRPNAGEEQWLTENLCRGRSTIGTITLASRNGHSPEGPRLQARLASGRVTK